jgi:triosephosphate isomerase
MISMRTPIIFGNWKMNLTIDRAQELAGRIAREVTTSKIEVGVAPPFTALRAVSEVLKGSAIHLAAQNLHWEMKGAYTGEISPEFVVDSGCDYVIIGHSERRQQFGETNDVINRKLKSSFSVGLNAILCVGETLEEREGSRTEDVVGSQVRECLSGLTENQLSRLVIAYEPIWAIGTGRTASPSQAQQVHQFIRSIIGDLCSQETSDALRMQYGGSVKPENAASLMDEPDIDGFLVGGASLTAASFGKIVGNSLEAM